MQFRRYDLALSLSDCVDMNAYKLEYSVQPNSFSSSTNANTGYPNSTWQAGIYCYSCIAVASPYSSTPSPYRCGEDKHQWNTITTLPEPTASLLDYLKLLNQEFYAFQQIFKTKAIQWAFLILITPLTHPSSAEKNSCWRFVFESYACVI